MAEEKEDVVITYETLFELLRIEKERKELQKLDDNFFINLIDYLKDKKAILEKQTEDLFSIEEREKTEKQLENLKKITKDLFERREKKIIMMALDKSRAKSSIVDESNLLKEEKEFFENLVRLLDKNREAILFNLLNLKEPKGVGLLFVEGKAEKKEDFKKNGKKRETKLIRFLHAVPKFVGKELEEYGPFEEEDVASLPIEIANVLIKKKRAEEISSD